MKKIWKVETDGRNLSNSDIVESVFDNRGIENIDHFLKPREEDLIQFNNLHNIDKAYNVVANGIDNNKSFLVYADCDVDGCTAGAIMTRYLYNYTDNVSTVINQGKEHGIEKYNINDCVADIIIIVDSINENEHYQKFIDNDKQVIILDHHIIPDNFRTDVILVSSANDYGNPELSGAGVVWKFCKYFDYMSLNDYADYLTDLASCGIIADMMNITSDENRYICDRGLRNQKNKGIKWINSSYEFNSQAVSFGIAPLINAANRLNLNQSALKLFLSDDDNEVKSIIKQLKSAKDKQNEIVSKTMQEIKEQVENQINNKVLFFAIDTDANISGLLANKLIGVYQRPVLVLKKADDGYAGSGRGIGVDNFKQLCDDTKLVWTGGHENAFGIEIKEENYADFQQKINSLLADIEFESKITADVKLDLQQIDNKLISSFKTINRISGTGFKPLSVMIDSITDYEVSSMSKGKHLKIVAGDITIIKWNFDGDFGEFDGRPLSVIGELNSSFFGRKFTKQIIISDYKLGSE